MVKGLDATTWGEEHTMPSIESNMNPFQLHAPIVAHRVDRRWGPGVRGGLGLHIAIRDTPFHA